ncbi:DUF2382 domain-containing protein [Nesterenkonia sp. CF4.4]|uniref:DUF2382 domain-containing protein n=1 Tax=Nesterenkonia sp. CF4.4 TaxID=3373079 RepID=UPI003EE652F2
MVNNSFDFDGLEAADVYDSEGAKVGSVGQVYVNEQTRAPEFVTVNLGLFGTKETFIPFSATNYSNGSLRVPFPKSYLKDAPNIDDDGHLSPEEERSIRDYYSTDRGTGRHGVQADGPGAGGDVPRSDAAGRDAKLDTENADNMIAHEERLKVGTEEREAGQVRLHKRVRTEHQNVEVPVQREELVVEREKVDPNSADARSAGTINEDGREEETVTLREERPVVEKETVATEKVNVGKRTVQDTETVSGEVRKEEIDVEEDGQPGAKR